jgi:hypothetical protein
MATPSIKLVQALRAAANNLKNGAPYAWGHHGTCNCGNLVKSISDLTEEKITMNQSQFSGEWTELANDYCKDTNTSIDHIFLTLEKMGLNSNDIHSIEYLNNRAVLAKLKGGFRWLERNNRAHVIEYFEAFASMMENQLIDNYQNLPAELIYTQLEVTV